MRAFGGAAIFAALSALTLSGCGGGGGSSGGATPPVALPGPTPSPTPTPTPTPPPPTYAAASDFTGDREYSGWGVEFTTTYSPPPAGSPPGTNGTSVYSTSLAVDTPSIGFNYAAANKSYTVRWFGSERSFGPVTSILFQDIIPTDHVEPYFFRSHFYASPTTPDYTHHLGYVRWQETEPLSGGVTGSSVSRSYDLLFGIPTLPADLPSTGKYDFEILGSRSYGGFASDDYRAGEDILLSVNWATGAIEGTITLQPAAPAITFPIVLLVSGTVDKATSRVTGTVTGSFSGSFAGAAFGPQGRELGIAMVLHNGSGGRIGAVVGGRANGMPAG